jgi:hypothetical protein
LADLSLDEQVRFRVVCRAILLRAEAQFELHEHGFYENWPARRAWVRGFLDQRAAAERWEGEKTQSMYSAAFVAEMDSARGIRVNVAGIASIVAPEKR